ncbi:MAG: hypothetical protein RQ745_14180 [Longimicrobiales bacterium]|nr:hypothetical protein [Longimicrobiales bacterium]
MSDDRRYDDEEVRRILEAALPMTPTPPGSGSDREGGSPADAPPGAFGMKLSVRVEGLDAGPVAYRLPARICFMIIPWRYPA